MATQPNVPFTAPTLTDNVFDEQNLKMDDVGSFYIPKHRVLIRPNPLGEDAHFLCLEKQTIGVADGVGACASRGVDAGEYARQLMKNCLEEIRKQPDHQEDIVPKLVLSKAYENTDHEGSCTACIVTLKGSFLHAVNVGDSSFVVIRRGRVVYRSPVQQYSFNCPYHLGKGDKEDCPESGMELKVAVLPGDTIVAGTDGLFDNVYATEIRKFVVEAFALAKSRDGEFLSPFAKAAGVAGVRFMGGKYDDITVVVARINMST